MPELPEVEVVRRGIEDWAIDRPIRQVEILDPRSLRRHPTGIRHFIDSLEGRSFASIERRGKYLWAPLKQAADELVSGHAPESLIFHLGMSGQVLMSDPKTPSPKHLKIRIVFDTGAQEAEVSELRFVDQRIFGGLFVDELIPTPDASDETIPRAVAHIGRDPLDPLFDPESIFRTFRRRKTSVKRALLDQSVSSGIGNIYADEALWRARLHFARPTETMTRREVSRLYEAAKQVMAEALLQGGTSFDSLYVNTQGEAGYFQRSLQVYSRENQLCNRCLERGEETGIQRKKFMNRSSYYCPKCQPVPRGARW